MKSSESSWQQGQMQWVDGGWLPQDSSWSFRGASLPSVSQHSAETPDCCTCARRRSCWPVSRQQCAEANWPS